MLDFRLTLLPNMLKIVPSYYYKNARLVWRIIRTRGCLETGLGTKCAWCIDENKAETNTSVHQICAGITSLSW